MKECYVGSSPNFIHLDADRDGRAFAAEIARRVGVESPEILVIDISQSFVDYYGCGPVIVSAIEAIHDSTGVSNRTIAILTSMNYGAKARYADLFFKGTKFEKPSIGFLDIAYQVCQEMDIEFKIWVVPRYDFVYTGLGALKNPTLILSSK